MTQDRRRNMAASVRQCERPSSGERQPFLSRRRSPSHPNSPGIARNSPNGARSYARGSWRSKERNCQRSRRTCAHFSCRSQNRLSLATTLNSIGFPTVPGKRRRGHNNNARHRSHARGRTQRNLLIRAWSDCRDTVGFVQIAAGAGPSEVVEIRAATTTPRNNVLDVECRTL